MILMHILSATPNGEEVEGKLCPFGANWALNPNGTRLEDILAKVIVHE